MMVKLNKTYKRLNFENNKLKKCRNPLKNNNGYEWSENFDSEVLFGNYKIYFNLTFLKI